MPLAKIRAVDAEKSEVRAAVARFVAFGLIALVVVALPVTLWIQAEAESYALSTATHITERLADNSLAPIVTETLLAGDPEALDAIDQRLAPWMEKGSIVRINIWDAAGTLVYSDQRELIGDERSMPGWTAALLADGPGRATFENFTDDEEDDSPGSGKFVEVYVGARAATGQPLIFEAYFDDTIVRDEQLTVLLGMTPAFLLSLAALQLAQLVPAVRLARKIQRHHAARRALLRQAIEASEIERVRIARVLHDEVIQELAGLAYVIEAEEARAEGEQRPVLTRARAILQGNLRRLRAITTDLYPPDLENGDLPIALAQLADQFRQQGFDIAVHSSDEFVLDDERSAVLYQVAREVLRNAIKHAGARQINVVLVQDEDITSLRVDDDGRGFDTAASLREGHFGLRIIRDTMRVAGGTVTIASRPGSGTVVVAEFVRVTDDSRRPRFRRQRRTSLWHLRPEQ